MVKVDMWYWNKVEEVTRIDISFYPNDGEYRGNIYINEKCVGDYVASDSVELTKKFQQLTFKWE